MPELYRMVPDIQERMDVWVRDIIDKIRTFAEVTYTGISDTRELADSAVREIEKFRCPEPHCLPVTYAPSFISIQPLSGQNCRLLFSIPRYLTGFHLMQVL